MRCQNRFLVGRFLEILKRRGFFRHLFLVRFVSAVLVRLRSGEGVVFWLVLRPLSFAFGRVIRGLSRGFNASGKSIKFESRLSK